MNDHDKMFDQDLQFERRWLNFERLAWVFMALVIGGALAGAFGRGVLAREQTQSADGSIAVKYESIARRRLASEIEIVLRGDAIREGSVELRFNSSFLGGSRVQSITPSPSHQQTPDGSLLLTFDADAGEPVKIVFVHAPEKIGCERFEIAAVNRAKIVVSRVVLP